MLFEFLKSPTIASSNQYLLLPQSTHWWLFTLCVCVCVCLCVYACMHVCACIYVRVCKRVWVYSKLLKLLLFLRQNHLPICWRCSHKWRNFVFRDQNEQSNSSDDDAFSFNDHNRPVEQTILSARIGYSSIYLTHCTCSSHSPSYASYGHCLVTLPCTINETLKWTTSLPILMQKSFWWWQCSG